MPNGADRNISRLMACVAAYRARHHSWPTHARLHPLVLYDIAHLLDAVEFARVADRMELRTQVPRDFRLGISVGGRFGVQWYEEIDDDHLPSHFFEEVAGWLGLNL